MECIPEGWIEWLARLIDALPAMKIELLANSCPVNAFRSVHESRAPSEWSQLAP
jgi:hypothetical protein